MPLPTGTTRPTSSVEVKITSGQVGQVLTTRQHASLAPGLRAEIADPLWMIGRQLQFGELAGEDASTPVRAEVVLDRLPLPALDPQGTPPEAHTEAEDPLAGPGGRRLRAELGLLLRRELASAGQLAVWETLQKALRPLEPRPDDGAELTLMLQRSIDGYQLRRALQEQGRSLSVGLQLLLRAVVPAPAQTAVQAWLDATTRWFVEPARDRAPWSTTTLSHTVQIPLGGGHTLHNPQYRGGRLDWDSLDWSTTPRAGTAPGGTPQRATTAAPTLARAARAPSARYWEIEGQPVDLGGLDVGPDEPLRVALAEYSLLWGDDRFVLPVPAERGALVRLSGPVRVYDAFTWRQPSRSATAASSTRPSPDTVPPLQEAGFQTFELHGAPTAPEGKGPWLLLLPGLAAHEEGPVVDETLFLVDEEHNLGWAVERLIEGPEGSARHRALPRRNDPPPGTPDDWQLTVWRGPPEGWFPLVLDTASRQLQRGHIPRPDGSTPDLPQGALLRPLKGYRIQQSELPPGGLVVTRRWQRARTADGRVWLWLGRQVRPARPSPSPGLVIDELQAP